MEHLLSLGKSWRKLHLKLRLNKLRKEMENHFQRKYKINDEVNWCTDRSPIVFYASEVWGIDCNGQLEKDPAEVIQNKFLKWLLRVNYKYCNNNAWRAETGMFLMRIEAQCRKFTVLVNLNQKWRQIIPNSIQWH